MFANSTKYSHDARGGWLSSDDRLKLRRVGILMEPEPGNPLGDGRRPDPAALVAVRRVLPFPAADCAGELLAHWDGTRAVRPSLDPASVERLGIAQEPEAA